MRYRVPTLYRLAFNFAAIRAGYVQRKRHRRKYSQRRHSKQRSSGSTIQQPATDEQAAERASPLNQLLGLSLIATRASLSISAFCLPSPPSLVVGTRLLDTFFRALRDARFCVRTNLPNRSNRTSSLPLSLNARIVRGGRPARVVLRTCVGSDHRTRRLIIDGTRRSFLRKCEYS